MIKLINVCPYLQYSFEILGKKWNGMILHYLSLCPDGKAHFSEIGRDLADITPRALSMKLSELIEFGLVEKKVTAASPVSISYQLTAKGKALTEALAPLQQWAQQYQSKEDPST